MFDFTSSKLLILGIVALLVIGPKDLPALLRTIGKYVGIIKRQAAEFRAQFDEAMRESELADLKKSVESIQHETETAVRNAQSTRERDMADARQSVEGALEGPKPEPASAEAQQAEALALNGASHPAEPTAATPTPASGEPASDDAARATEKHGA